uniref:DUF5641 domain-containing protein n=1 Tax=Phlebotomus papatasi TaxID=29031 RepID=A0A1B0DHX2_PHLPP
MSTEFTKHSPSDEVLSTLFAEAANMVNSRPLLELSDSGEPVKVNDRVVVIDPNRPRNYWPIGRVIETRPGYDGKVRIVKIKMEDDGKEYVRSVAHLAVLRPPPLIED